MTLENAQISELLARAGDERQGERQRAYRRAARHALMWPEQASDVLDEGRSLTELSALGPRLSGLVRSWLTDAPEVPDAPPTRRGFMSFAHALEVTGRNPAFAEALRGDLQMHTTESDGSLTAGEMAGAAIDLGYEYIAITDHSVGLKIAGGMSIEQMRAQREGLDVLNERLASETHDFQVLRSIEMNLDQNGNGDLSSEDLEGLDIVVGSFHSKLRRQEDQTERGIRAVSNPDVHILGHPRGRMFNSRVGVLGDWDSIFDAAAEHHTALELNSHPNRQDLDVESLIVARDSGCMFSIGTDAHVDWEMRFVDLGMAAALEADIPQERILNFMPREQLLAWVAESNSRKVR
ncbi:MAG: PHP domain-containing protein [Actinomycetota bacterium]|nr:PHP domain-containing protein [Actinomycetota bacterium]